MFKLSLKRRRTHTNSKNGYGEVLNSLHFFLINKEVNIAWKYYESSLEFVFYAEFAKDLEDFKSFIEENSDLINIFDKDIMKYRNTFKSISSQLEEIHLRFTVSQVKYFDLSIESTVYYMKTKSNNDRISRSILIKKIDYILNFKPDKEKVLSPLNSKLERLFKLMDIKKESDLKIINGDDEETVNKKNILVKEIQLRMEKSTDLFSLSNIYYSNQNNRKNKMFFKEVSVIENDFNFKTNRYGLSTGEFKFPVPKNI